MVYLIIILIIIAIDLVSKYLVNKYLENGKEKVFSDKFSFIHLKNEGIAYSRLNGYINKIIILSGVLIAYITIAFAKSIRFKSGILEKIGFSFLLGGACGNFIERVRNKNITDFLYIKYKNLPVFNIADISIFIGAIFILVYNIIKKN